jgi:uncharacterized pyridoxamine 5'-phosphate oxidase family protein
MFEFSREREYNNPDETNEKQAEEERMNRILDFLEQNPVFYFTTVEAGEPRVRPFGFYMSFEGKLYFGMGKQKKSYAQLVQNPNVELCVADPTGRFLRVRGVAVFDERPEVRNRAFETMPRLKALYNDETGHVLAPFYLTDGEAEFADLKGNFEQFTF